VFETGPVFRAEKSHTAKHATEFTGFDLEFTGVDSVEDVMKMEENLIVSGIRAVVNKYGKEINETFGELSVPTKPFPRMDLNEVYKELKERYGYEVLPNEVGDLPTEGEKLCKQLAKDKFNHEFIFITGFDTNLRAFYHFRNEQGVAQGYDLI
jgi:aspartyl-tRNA synthetase